MFLLPPFLFNAHSFNAAHAEEITIGVSAPLTGEAASYGTDIKNSFIFANRYFAQSRYTLIFEDDRCRGTDAVTVAHKFIDRDKVTFVSGFGCSGALLAAAPIYNAGHRVTIGVATSAPAISNAGDYIFRTSPSDVDSSRELVRFIAQKHRRLAIISEQTDYCAGFLNSLKESAPDSLSLHVGEFQPGTSDLQATLFRLRSQNPDSLFINTQAEGALAEIVTKLHTMHWNVDLFGAYFVASPSFLNAVGPLAEGITFVDLPSVDTMLSKEKMGVYQTFLSEFGPPKSNDFMFVVSTVAFQALDQAIQSGQDPRRYLLSASIPTILGNISFNKSGDIQQVHPVMKTIREGKPIRITAAAASIARGERQERLAFTVFPEQAS